MTLHLKSTFAFILRNWRRSEIQLMAVAIVISVAAITSIAFLIQTVRNGLEDKASILLGSDRVITSPIPIDPSITDKAKNLKLEVTHTLSFLSMLVHHQDLALADVRAVGEGYPLRGELRTASDLFVQDEATLSIPEPGTVWLEARLFPMLNVKVGDTIEIGSAAFKITRVLTGEPDRTLELINLQPWALINEVDIPATKIIQPGSRVTYKLLIAGKEESLEAFEEWVKLKLTSTQTWVDTHHSRPMMNVVVERVNHYLGLVFLINVSLAGVAIAMVSRQFSQKQFDTVAILRCLGASDSWIVGRYSISLIIFGLLLGASGIVLGYGICKFLLHFYFEEKLISGTETLLGFPIIVGFLTILVLLLGFALPPVLRLRKIPPLRVIRRDLPGPTLSQGGGMFLGLLAVIALIMVQTRDVQLIIPLILFTVGFGLILWMIIRLVLRSTVKIGRFLRISAQLNIRNLERRANQNALQVLAFSLVLGLLGTLYLVRNNLLTTWEAEVPPFAPNHFVLNVPPQQLPLFQSLLQQHSINTTAIYPMMVARLIAVNEDLVEMNGDPLSNKRVFNRLLNITWAETLPVDNKVVEGKWFNENDKGQWVVSIEQGFADRLKVKLGDTLKLQIAEKTIEPRVTSIRTVNWNSFQPNFFVMFPPGVIDTFPITYMTSFYLPPTDVGFLKTLVNNFPMISIIDTQMITSQLRSFIKVISNWIGYLWGLTVVISLILLFATIISTLDERKEEALLLRILGVGNRQLGIILLSEFLLLGLLAGIIGVIGANTILYWLSHQLFNLPYYLDGGVLIVLPMLGMILVAVGGWLGTRRVFLAPPLRIMGEF